MTQPPAKWTEAHDQQLRDLTDQGISLDRMSEIMGFTVACLVRKRKILGLAVPNGERPLTDDQETTLRTMLAAYKPLAEIMEVLHIGPHRLRREMKRLGLVSQYHSGRTIVWTDEQIAQARELWFSDMMTSEIADRLGIDVSTLGGKMRRLGFSQRSEIRRSWDEKRKADARQNTAAAPERIGAGRDPLRAGHPIALAAIGAAHLAEHFR